MNATLFGPLEDASPGAPDLHNAFFKWVEENGLVINQKKCKALTVCLRGTGTCSSVNLPDVSPVQELKILGVTFDCNLNWNVVYI